MLAQEKEDAKAAEGDYRKVIDIELGYKAKPAADYSIGTLCQAYFNLGVLMDKQGRFSEAIEQMKKVIQNQPNNADAYNYIGYSYADKNINLEEAQKDVEAALKIDPDNSYYLDSLGWVFYRRGKYREAREQLEKSLKLLKSEQKDDAVIYDHLAEVLLKMGQPAVAVDQWEKAVKLDPDNKDYPDKIKKNKNSDSL
jgi:tetratricopeptide (TPR) repeat protein